MTQPSTYLKGKKNILDGEYKFIFTWQKLVMPLERNEGDTLDQFYEVMLCVNYESCEEYKLSFYSHKVLPSLQPSISSLLK